MADRGSDAPIDGDTAAATQRLLAEDATILARLQGVGGRGPRLLAVAAGVTPPARLDEARRELGLALIDLWVEYFTFGGTKTAGELAAYLTAGDPSYAQPTSDADHEALVLAINERYADAGGGHPLPYRAA